jgi:hypothetical protein
MSSPGTPPKKRPLLRVALFGVGLFLLGTAVFFGWVALETYVFAERIRLVASKEKLRVGMTQEEVEDLFGLRPEDRKAPDPGIGSTSPHKPNDGVFRFMEDRDRQGIHVHYVQYYRGLLVTSSHHLIVIYDPSGKLKEWWQP